MDYLNWELSILSRAVAWPNLTGAAAHVGVSQSQLSRIVAKLEAQLDTVLLDREARRKSAWTPEAQRLAEIYASTERKFQGSLQEALQGLQLTHIKIGTLEGLVETAMSLTDLLLREAKTRVLELSVLDLDALERDFSRGEFELIFTSREPRQKNPRYMRRLGYQTLERTGAADGVQVLSSFEFGTRAATEEQPVLVSNSLEVRKRWISQLKGTGIIPSPIHMDAKARPASVPVLLIGSDLIPTQLCALLDRFEPQ